MSEVATTTETTAKLPVPQGQTVTAPTQDDAQFARDYIKLAKDLGFDAGVTQLTQKQKQDAFNAFLAEHGIRKYEYKTVRDYLDQQYGATPWGWRALRDQDNPKKSLATPASRTMGVYIGTDGIMRNNADLNCGVWQSKHNGNYIGGKDAALYNKPIPYPVLLTVKKIADAFPEATFWVSDEAKVVPVPVLDPFLGVRYADKFWIIERWDEPSFRD